MKHNTITSIAKLLSVSLSGSALLMQPAMATMPDTHIFSHATEIPDEVLAGMRGRYAGPGEILYFGVDIVTQWQTADGRQFNAGVNLSVDKQYHPTITIVTQNAAAINGAASQTSVGHGNVTISGGLGNVSGVAQSIQIGGDGNAIRNDLNMNIKLNSSESGANNDASNGIAIHGAGTTSIDENGGKTTVTLSGNNLTMAVDVAGQGQVMQQLRGGANGNAGFLQSSRVGGDMNQIHNVININANLSGANGMSVPGLQGTLETLRGIRSAGAF